MEFGREPDSSFGASKLDDRPNFSSLQLRTSSEPAPNQRNGIWLLSCMNNVESIIKTVNMHVAAYQLQHLQSIPRPVHDVMHTLANTIITRMWANAQPDGRPAEHRWRPLFNAAKFG